MAEDFVTPAGAVVGGMIFLSDTVNGTALRKIIKRCTRAVLEPRSEATGSRFLEPSLGGVGMVVESHSPEKK